MAEPANPTPAEREQRIAELRARRRARRRKLAIRSGIGVVVLAALALVALYWLLMTFGGRDFLLSQIVARLPAGTELHWRRAEGPASGPLILTGVRYVQRSCPDKDGQPVSFGQCADPGTLVFTAQRVVVDPDVRPLLGKLLRLDALDISGATLEIPNSDKPFELPRWPGSLPDIQLPLDLQADTIRIDGFKVSKGGEPMIDIRSLRGGLDARDGTLHAGNLVIDSDRGRFTANGDYSPRRDFRTDLTASALLPAPTGRTRPRIGLAARGDLARMDVAIAGNAPAPLHVLLTLRGKTDPRWRFSANSRELDPALLIGSGEPGTPLAFDLRADGIGGVANVHGKLARDELVAVLQPSKLRVEDQVLALDPLVVDVFGGRITARGHGDFKMPEHANFKFAVDARDLMFGSTAKSASGEPPSPPIGADAALGIAGTPSAWAALGKATLTRDGQSARVDFNGRGNADAMTLKSAHVSMPTGGLDATGKLGWAPALHWDIDATMAGFDPGYFAPGWNGAVRGSLSSQGKRRDDGGLEVQVVADKLGGSLRGRKLDGHATLALHGPATGKTRTDYAGDIALTLGASRIDAKGSVADRWNVDAKLSPLQLADALPGTAGILRGSLALGGARNAPDVSADLSGSALKYGDYGASSLTVKGRLPWTGSGGALAINAKQLDLGVALDSLRVDARGAVEDLRLDAHASGAIGVLDLAGNARKRGQGWQGALESLRLAPARGAAWRLQSPARFTHSDAAFTLAESCFASSGGGSLCASADWPRRGLSVDGRALPLALLEPYLPDAVDGRPWRLRGEIALDGRVRPSGNAYAGSFRLDSASGGVRTGRRNPDKVRKDVFSYDGLALEGSFDARRIEATLASGISGGRVDAHVVTGWDAYAPLAGKLALDTDELTWLELFSPDIVEPTGKLSAHIDLGGTRAQPTLGGQATLAGFNTEIPSLGVALEQGDFRLDALPDGSARIGGNARLGDGTLAVDGTLGWQGDASTPLLLHVTGKNALVADTRDLHLVADPDVQVRYLAGQPLKVTGTVTVPSALIDLESLDEGVSVSPDVVVLDPVDPENGNTGPLALELDLTLAMGKDVRLKGFGLDGTLGGKLRARAFPGREMTGEGVLNVGGRYKAYGQELRITRGELQWSNNPISDPILDIRAERRIEAEDITAGIDVTGRASAPQASVWTDPASNQSDALSYLALGRASSSLSSAEGRQIDAASTALNAGGNYLAGKLGAKLGLDNAGVTDSRALGGSVLGIGKQLSPRLYVGFGVSLLGTGQVLTLKYLLRKGFDIEIESSTLESRGSINWRKEK